MITTIIANAATITATNLESREIEVADEEEEPGLLGEGAGDTDSAGQTLIASFIPFSQCLPTPQMYHFFPGEVREISSFPDIKGVTSVLGVQLLKAS